METPNINSQLFYELGDIADNSVYMARTLSFLKNIKNSHGFYYTQLLEKLSDYQEYEYDWDGDGALPLDSQAVKNFKSVLKRCEDDALENWSIFPSANGTILFQYDKKKCGINIGKNDFSYYVIADGNVKGENSVPFSSEIVLECMKKLAE